MFAKKGDKKLSQKGPEMQFFYKPKVRGKRKKIKVVLIILARLYGVRNNGRPLQLSHVLPDPAFRIELNITICQQPKDDKKGCS